MLKIQFCQTIALIIFPLCFSGALPVFSQNILLISDKTTAYFRSGGYTGETLVFYPNNQYAFSSWDDVEFTCIDSGKYEVIGKEVRFKSIYRNDREFRWKNDTCPLTTKTLTFDNGLLYEVDSHGIPDLNYPYKRYDMYESTRRRRIKSREV